MDIEIKDGGDGVVCWNRDAIEAYAAATANRIATLRERNADLEVVPGRIKCFGCHVQEGNVGTRCTAQLKLTLYGIAGEKGPRASDADAPLQEIPGLTSLQPDSGALSPSLANGGRRMIEPNSPPVVEPRGRLRNLFGR